MVGDRQVSATSVSVAATSAVLIRAFSGPLA